MDSMKINNIVIKRLIHDGDERSYKGRFERLKYLLSINSLDEFPAPALAWEYYEEARLCWYSGAFVATIIMAQLAFEELIRSTYRVAKGVRGKLANNKKVDKASFSDLIWEAEQDKIITKKEAENLNKLRKLRNPFVHTKDLRIEGENKITLGPVDFFYQHLKIVASHLIGQSAENEAKFAIKLLCNSFPKISYRLGGI